MQLSFHYSANKDLQADTVSRTLKMTFANYLSLVSKTE